jgi:hypothetical protein
MPGHIGDIFTELAQIQIELNHPITSPFLMARPGLEPGRDGL